MEFEVFHHKFQSINCICSDAVHIATRVFFFQQFRSEKVTLFNQIHTYFHKGGFAPDVRELYTNNQKCHMVEMACVVFSRVLMFSHSHE